MPYRDCNRLAQEEDLDNTGRCPPPLTKLAMFTNEWLELKFELWIAQELPKYITQSDPITGKLRRQYLQNGYLHFDPRIWLPDRIDEFRKLLTSPDRIARRAFLPFLRVLVKTPRFRYSEKKGKRALEFKPRPICYASHFDALVYSFYGFCLNEIYQEYVVRTGIENCVLAYRTDLNKCNIDFAREAFDYISKRGNCLAIALDIKGFFDNIDHSILKEKWKKVMGVPTLPLDHFRVFKSLTKFSYVNRNTLLKFQGINLKNCQPKPKVLLEPTVENFKEIRERNLIVTNKMGKGIPQGSGMSAVLSNVYMIDFDAFMMGLAEANDMLYLRYCDDILIVCNQFNSERIIEKVYQEIENYGLEIQKKKEEKILFMKDPSGRLNSFNAKKLQQEGFSVPPSTHEGKFQKNLQYLGFEFNGKEAFIRSSSMSRYYRRMKARVRKTVNMAYGSKGKGRQIFKKRLYSRYTHLGKRNFITYALRSASPSYFNSDKQERFGMNSNSIRRQVARHFAILKRTVKLKSIERAAWKEKKLKE